MTPDPRLYCDYPQLAGLRAQEPLCQLPPFHRLRQLISGQHVSRLRGRGLNFEELRHYRQGDDIRQLDWRVTFRTGKPHVRVYNEEKDHHVLLCVDQRASMFFASLDTMKSVVAAQSAALLGWSVIRHSDRLALCLFNDDDVAVNTPIRSQRGYLTQLRQLAQFNLALNVNSRPEQTSGLVRLLDQLLQRHERNALIVIASDFHDCDDAVISRFQQLQRHNRALCILISDPLEHTLQNSDWVISDGIHQTQIATGKVLETVNELLIRQCEERHQQLQRLMQMSHLPLIELDTSGHHLHQLRHALGVAL
ncbi:DUF58 domain-containing protein [Aeromonas enteropelogenes]|uniref:DUF58 domain-containing protein n=1 Tax=Aeromonas enteropelogenes TaxID=29489 RepID=UPI003BA0F15E